MQKQSSASNKYWLVSVDMGYGHMRAAYPLLNHAELPYVIANDYEGIPEKDRKIWLRSRKFYEAFSRLNQVPLVGDRFFDLLDWWQEIEPFYPRRNLSAPNIATKTSYKLFKSGYMKHLVDKLSEKNLPMITTFFLPALAADYHGFKQEIYCIITDTDFSRSWVALNPKKSKIKYFAPTRRAKERLKLYGVPAKNIILTGFPLPKENIGLGYEKIKKHLTMRLINLDPYHHYRRSYNQAVCNLLGEGCLKDKSDHPLTLMFAVGGAGAQRKIAEDILRSLSKKLRKKSLRLILVAGSRQDVNEYFVELVSKLRLKSCLGKSLKILYAPDKNAYFKLFNKELNTCDILWTKPSELSFYVGMGLPIIMAPPIGSQEDFNESWLRNVGAGIPQHDPKHVAEWLDDMLESGWLARAAMNGFTNAPKRGAYRIESIVALKKPAIEEPVEPI